MPWRADGGAGPSPPECERARDRIDPYLEDELPRREAAEVERHLAACPDCRAELAMARRLREALRAGLPMLACPPEVTDRVLAIAREESGEAAAGVPGAIPVGRRPTLRSEPVGRRPVLRRWFDGGGLRAALAAAAVLLLLVAAPLLYRAVVPPPSAEAPELAAGEGEPAYSAAEIARAEEEARLVLGYVAAIGRDAGRAVQEEVLAGGIGRPARHLIEGLEAAGLGREPVAAGPPERRTQ
ncbi:MAG TPA: anti-sigma factor [Thermoanaerobaculia bacterium]|nr:anti-sigma factor [Thermoanaerobaculia bacterium]